LTEQLFNVIIFVEYGKKETGEKPVRVRRRRIRFFSQQDFRKILNVIGFNREDERIQSIKPEDFTL